MGKTCILCNNKIKKDEFYCWKHNDKPKKINKKKEKRRIEEIARKYGKIMKTGYMNQLVKYRNDTSKHFEKEKIKFKKLEERHKQLMKIWEELYDEEYQVIPNKMKEFREREK